MNISYTDPNSKEIVNVSCNSFNVSEVVGEDRVTRYYVTVNRNGVSSVLDSFDERVSNFRSFISIPEITVKM